MADKLGHLEKLDLVIVATGVLSGPDGPVKSFKELSSEEMTTLFSVNAVGGHQSQEFTTIDFKNTS